METKKLLVTLEERKLIQKEMSVEFGTKVKYRVMDLDKVVARLRDERARFSLTPYIEIKPVSPDMHKMPSRTGTFQKDPITGVLYGIPIDQDEFGNMRWQKIQIGDNLSLNLDNINDAKIWSVLRFNPDIKGSPFQVQSPYYEVFDPVEAARNEMGEVAQMKKAFDRIDSLKERPVDMVNFARFLGEEIRENASLDIIYNTLLRFARSYPGEFNKKWESRSRSYGEKFASAKAVGVVTQDVDRGYIFRNIPLGLSDEDAIRFLSKDMNIMNAINEEIMNNDEVIKSIRREVEFNKKKEGEKEPVGAQAEDKKNKDDIDFD